MRVSFEPLGLLPFSTLSFVGAVDQFSVISVEFQSSVRQINVTMWNDLLCVYLSMKNAVTSADSRLSSKSITNRNDDYKKPPSVSGASFAPGRHLRAAARTAHYIDNGGLSILFSQLALIFFFAQFFESEVDCVDWATTVDYTVRARQFWETFLKIKKPYFLIDSRALQSRLFMFPFVSLLALRYIYVCVCDYQSEIMTSIIK